MASITASCARGSVSSTFGAQASLGKGAAGVRPASVQLRTRVPCFVEHCVCSRRQPSNMTCLAVSASSEQTPPAAQELKSILCTNCEGNGAVVCSQCKGEGLNAQDYFGGRFKAGTICWLCRGKKQMLCGNCNGAGFMGGFLNTQDD